MTRSNYFRKKVCGGAVFEFYVHSLSGMEVEMRRPRLSGPLRRNRMRGTVEIPSIVMFEGERYRVTKIGDGAFEGCENIVDVVIPQGVTKIGERAFSGCVSLCSVSIPDTVEVIEPAAFAECSSLDHIDIPKSVRRIGAAAFYRCYSLESAVLASTASIPLRMFEGCMSLVSVTIGGGVTNIGDEAFRNCLYLTSLTIPSSVEHIGDGAFESCRALRSISFKGGADVIRCGIFGDGAVLAKAVLREDGTLCEDVSVERCPESAERRGKESVL